MYGLSCIWALEACTHIIYRLNSVYVIVYVLRHRMASRNPRTRAVNVKSYTPNKEKQIFKTTGTQNIHKNKCHPNKVHL
jgi:hypothetical protein